MNSKDPSGPENKELLIRRASGGDLAAFNALVSMYQDMVFDHAYAMLGDPAWAEDAAQESFIKAFENIPTFRGGSFRAWLLRIVTNSAYDFLRKVQRQPAQPLFPMNENGEELESPVWLADPAALVEAAVEAKESAEHLYALLDELPDFYRSVITLVDIHELDYAEAARALNVPMGTIKSRLARARLQMKMKLETVQRA